jgi:aspartate/glutamate racemase
MRRIGLLGGMSWESTHVYYRWRTARRRGVHPCRGRRRVLLVLCTNTMHKVADEIAGAVDIPFVHIADTTAEAVPTWPSRNARAA